MHRSDELHDPAFGARFKQAVERTYPSKGSFAEAVRIRASSLSRYFDGRLPRGSEMQRIAAALAGQFEWVLTGRQPTALERASLVSAEMRAALEILDRLNPEAQAVVAGCLRILDSGQTQWISTLTSVTQSIEGMIAEGRAMAAESPEPFDTPECA